MKDNPNCYRCGATIDRPIPQNANYVIGTDTVESEEVEVLYALKHTELTKRRLNFLDEELEKGREAISAEISHPNAPERVEVDRGTKVEEREGGRVETADHREVAFSVPENYFPKEEVDDPNVVRYDDDVSRVVQVVEEREKQKTGIVCPDCAKDDDEIMWGIDD